VFVSAEPIGVKLATAKRIVKWFVCGFIATSLLFWWSLRQGDLIPKPFMYVLEDKLQRAAIPVGYFDTFEEGQRAASRDIDRNEMKFAVYGLVEAPLDDEYAKYNVTPILSGCVTHRPGWEFWRGYNTTIVSEMKRRGLELPDNRIWTISLAVSGSLLEAETTY